MKKLSFNFLVVVLCFAALPPKCLAQQTPDLGKNAALQYYSAFLQMKDADISDADVQAQRYHFGNKELQRSQIRHSG